MRTMQEEWRKYRDKVYPQGVSAIQNRETHQAFFCGAAMALALMTNDIPALPDPDAEKAIQGLINEVMEVCQYRADTLKARN